jgi:hypothetical protein
MGPRSTPPRTTVETMRFISGSSPYDSSAVGSIQGPPQPNGGDVSPQSRRTSQTAKVCGLTA